MSLEDAESSSLPECRYTRDHWASPHPWGPVQTSDNMAAGEKIGQA